MENCNNSCQNATGEITKITFASIPETFYGFTADEMILQVSNGLSKYSIYNRKQPEFILMHPDAIKFLVKNYFNQFDVKPKRIYKPKLFGVNVYRTKDIKPTSVKVI
jgi:hypothetical protein